jgi:hypothetical protein
MSVEPEIKESERRGRGDAPNSTRTEEHAIVGTYKRALLIVGTNILDAREKRFFHADLQKPSQERCNSLSHERCTGRDLDVVAQLEILGKDERRSLSLDSIAFEDLVSG